MSEVSLLNANVILAILISFFYFPRRNADTTIALRVSGVITLSFRAPPLKKKNKKFLSNSPIKYARQKLNFALKT